MPVHLVPSLTGANLQILYLKQLHITFFTYRKYALEALTKMGANMITTESVVLGLAPDSSHPNFRQLQKLCFQSAADTGL